MTLSVRVLRPSIGQKKTRPAVVDQRVQGVVCPALEPLRWGKQQMRSLSRRVRIALGLVGLLVLAACGSGGDEGGDANAITVWTTDTIPDRVAATEAIIARFTQQTGIQVELVGVDEDQFNQLLTSAAAAGDLPDVIGSIPLSSVRTLATNDLTNTEANRGGDRRARRRHLRTSARWSSPGRATSSSRSRARPGRSCCYYRTRPVRRRRTPGPEQLRRHPQRGRARSTPSRWRGSSAPRHPATRSPSRRSSTSRWPTAARW